ncbi:MAG: hypothetical protein KAI17_02555, partial [Thiotrichaceae bacterium]|nr:hypothetical protein [Thiotrichaceae bacterium]
MKTIGIDTDNYLVYEGNGTWGHALWPTPAILPAAIVSESSDELSPVNNNDLQKLPFIFMDEGYDPVSRVRKGIIYEKYESQPNDWHVQMHPAIPAEGRQLGARGVIKKSLASFQQFNFEPVLKQLGIENPLIVLGSNTQFTIWSVIDVETSISGETILFLRARKTIGVLPKVNYSTINEKYHSQIKDKLARLSSDIHKAGPDSIIDRSREAASAIVNTYLLENGHIEKHRDLGQLVSTLRDKAKKHVAANCADT